VGATKAFLDDKPLAGTATWQITSGVRPFTTTVLLAPKHAAALLGGAAAPPGATTPDGPGGGAGPQKPVTMTWRETKFRAVYVLGRAPGPNPYVASVTIADRRWLWNYAAYRRSFNVPRKVGQQRLVSPN
jgi:hypothetical protein